MAISQEMPQPSIMKICLKITYLKFHLNFPGANELMKRSSCLFPEPYSGSQGLPPPRSVAMDRQRQAQANPNRDRVKVFMPQQYNTPITMYSAANIMDTFQGQAGAHIENMDEYVGTVDVFS